MTQNLLNVSELEISFKTESGTVTAVAGVSFALQQGETLGIVGESGCGKSVTSLSLMRLLPNPPGRISGGRIELNGRNLLELSEREMRDVRGNAISMIFQEPMTSLNPVFTIGRQIDEAILLHKSVSKREARALTIEILKKVGIPRPEQIAKDYPHQLSGGMRQRVMIAMALVCEPQLLIADEPTTALDVTIQAQILDLMDRLKRETGTSILLITHDLGVVAEMCDRVLVMYAGQVVEEASAEALFAEPKHPYTVGLLNSIPHADRKADRLPSIAGSVPSLTEMPNGCRFAPRCPVAIAKCHQQNPALVQVTEQHKARCWLAQEGGEARV
ncbi:ABC transporter ATP-binding protein [Tumebacillus permanentifrigoris]|uniref:Peptide/nickel transport system ATP-binding protein/oligopeptide transport system ATP-binding protein n=1 Tax=Tumebacillus permanentifrigoris TaxID=378543 RepID=A0A316DFC1_9BACL|nr:ABC transporter ATP-binding protein [Tumebacillus permanentifrigoris]PWK16416.1 peptide/nickel transport system ATP-binding protein/oligopeptide transport system ATP-binding protein [Tumebacillus permanentifrigoris]